ncbi:DNA-binding transcriptional regulator, MerR family [Lentzea waywayandensis]|uniref:DNA-binding transcriptional regulator, MerR family n=1 Tax=Lentzea waywayandensis TaxID=84724 RepID=A0A1I6EYB4_9PSEU|nr:MerR family transcriptional regulator [Lentzea waywayandensis]SFR22670.1 DNA-binding transcriptional regulator, MerR family [Lentzea waywayandensis]
MGWSTSQLADLAGTTVRTIRHYHEVGLLAEPERRANGYKRYGVPHLVRVMRIKRLTDLGLSLTQIANLGDEDEHPGDALRELDAELAATIERLQRIRTDLALILRQEAPTDLPPDVAAMIAEANLSPQDRSFTVVLAQLLSPETLARYAETLKDYSKDPAVVEFDALPEDADEQTRQSLAERMRAMPYMAEIRAAFPDAAGLYSDAPRGVEHAKRTVIKVLVELYNKAQLDVLVRMRG